MAGALFRSPQDGFWDQKVCHSLAVASPPHAQSAGTTERDGATHAALPSHVIDPKLLLYHYLLRTYLLTTGSRPSVPQAAVQPCNAAATV